MRGERFQQAVRFCTAKRSKRAERFQQAVRFEKRSKRAERYTQTAMGSLAALVTLAALVVTPSAAENDVSTAVPFDPSSRGAMMYGDPCTLVKDCGFPDSICDDVQKTCRCHPTTPVTNHVDKCGRPAGINETCIFNEQCEDVVMKTECRNDRCACLYEMIAEVNEQGTIVCNPEKEVEISTKTLDPAMIGVLVGMALMFVIICVVLQLFSRARWRENRSIFNTPNPRLMNVSLLRDSKLLHSQDRRGSRVSVRPPSRQNSQHDLRPHSPLANHARHHQQSHQLHRKPSGSRRGSRASSGHSASSLRSATLRSPTTPGPTSVTVEIRAPDV